MNIVEGFELIYTVMKRCVELEMHPRGLLRDVESFIPIYYNESGVDEPCVWMTQHPTVTGQKANISKTVELVTPFEFDCVVYESDLEDSELAGQNLAHRVILSVVKNLLKAQSEVSPDRRLIRSVDLETYYPVGQVNVQGKSDRVPATGVILNVNHVINWPMCCKSDEPEMVIKYTGDLLLNDNSTGVLVGDGIVLNFDDGTEVEYTGKESFNHPQGSGEHELWITGNITEISSGCFVQCSNMNSITLPDTLTTVFLEYCTGLTEINIPNSVTNLGLSSCTGLTEINIPNSVTQLGLGGCTGLTEVTIPNKVTTINFRGCTGLTTIDIPESVTTIQNNCFRDCTNLETINLNWATNIPTYNPMNRWLENTPAKFTVPAGTLQTYINKGYPSNKLIERE